MIHSYNNMQAFRFKPQLFERAWGGHALADKYGRIIPNPEQKYGESWEISDRPEANSIVAEGPLKGSSLHELWTTRKEELFGRGYDSYEQFPLLCKIIDATEELSIQIHPNEKAINKTGGEPKNEIWYIADSEQDARIYAGFKQGTTLEDIKKGLEDETLEVLLNQYHLGQGDSFYIPAGLVHAIGRNNVIFEIQQNSDTTYRLYDWGRKPERELHIEQSFQCLEGYDELEYAPRPSNTGCIADTPYFHISDIRLGKGQPIPISAPDRFSIVTVVEGTLALPTGLCKKGDFILVPANAKPFFADSEARILVTNCPV